MFWGRCTFVWLLCSFSMSTVYAQEDFWLEQPDISFDVYQDRPELSHVGLFDDDITRNISSLNDQSPYGTALIASLAENGLSQAQFDFEAVGNEPHLDHYRIGYYALALPNNSIFIIPKSANRREIYFIATPHVRICPNGSAILEVVPVRVFQPKMHWKYEQILGCFTNEELETKLAGSYFTTSIVNHTGGY